MSGEREAHGESLTTAGGLSAPQASGAGNRETDTSSAGHPRHMPRGVEVPASLRRLHQWRVKRKLRPSGPSVLKK